MTNPNTGKVPLTVPVTVNLPKPPDGMEWKVSEFIPQREYYAGKMVTIEAVLRPIVSATVMVEMLRDDAGWVESQCRPSDLGQAVSDRAVRVANTMRAALARKPDSQCGEMHSQTSNDWHSNCPDCRGHGCTPCARSLGHEGPHADRKPCPVMVCALYGGKSKDCWRKDTHEQRPCKLSEGHGGAHE